MFDEHQAPLTHEGEAVLYRILDTEDHLLYIGITRNIWTRMAQHRRTARWWPRAARVVWVDMPTRKAAEDAEIMAVYCDGPECNVKLRQTERLSREYARRGGLL